MNAIALNSVNIKLPNLLSNTFKIDSMTVIEKKQKKLKVIIIIYYICICLRLVVTTAAI